MLFMEGSLDGQCILNVSRSYKANLFKRRTTSDEMLSSTLVKLRYLDFEWLANMPLRLDTSTLCWKHNNDILE